MQKVRPQAIRLDASTRCQLACPSCVAAKNSAQATVGSGFLKYHDFKKLASLNPWVKEIELANNGEIILNPDILAILEYAHHNGIAITANSGLNLNTASEDILEGLVKNKVRSASCSLDGASNETYRQYRVKGDFDTVIGNINRINQNKRKHKSKYPLLRWQFIVFGHNEHEIPIAKKMAKDLNMEFNLKLNNNPSFSPVRNEEMVRKEIGSATREEYKQKFGVDYARGVCFQLWDAPQINWDGKIFGCCWNLGCDFGGNAFHDGLVNALNGEKIQYARDMLLGNKPGREDIQCNTCSLYIDMKESGNWLKRNFSHKALRFGYGHFNIPYEIKLKSYRLLKGNERLPPGRV